MDGTTFGRYRRIRVALPAQLATLMLVDYYLRILHLDRRLPLNFDVGPLHVHLYARSVFFMWVTVVILVIAGRPRGACIAQA